MAYRSSTLGDREPQVGFALLVGLVLLVAFGKPILFDSMDPDCFWHLRVAQQLRDGIGPLIDHLSFGSMDQPWTPYSWLAELGMEAVWRAGGPRAIIAQAVLEAAIIALVACASRAGIGQREAPDGSPPTTVRIGLRADATAAYSHSARPLESALATAAAAFIALPYLSFRPVTAALALLALGAYLIVRDRRAGERTLALWWLVPITALVVNLHLYAIFVPMWIGALLLGAAWERRAASPEDRPEAERRLTRYGWLLAGTAAACLCTPMLPGVVASALHYQYGDPMVASGMIAEMKPFYFGPAGKLALALVVLLTGFMLTSRQTLRAGEWLWFALAAALLLRLGRFAPPFAIVAAPMFAATMPRLSGRILFRPVACAMMAFVLIGGIVRLALEFPRADAPLAAWLNRHGPEAPGYPCAAADYVAAHVAPATGRLINEFTWGGYLEWHLGEHYQTLLDGRTQVFSPDFWQATYLGTDDQREQYLSQLAADAAVLPARKSKFHDALVHRGWRVAYRDPEGRAEVLLPPPTELTDRTTPSGLRWSFAEAWFGE